MAVAVEDAEQKALERLRWDTEFYAERFLKILPKTRSRGLIPFTPNLAQKAFEARLEEQRQAGKPARAVILKARQVGFSTYCQAKLVQRSTLWGNHNALVVAHDVDTGGKLFAMGQRMYRNLPTDLDLGGVPLKPDIRSYRRARFLHFGQTGHLGMVEDIWPDSTYFVDTASEFEAGRGGTYHAMHGSELGFWPQPEPKYIALMQAIPDDPETFVALESTANGHNFFKEVWDDAYEGRSEFIAFFWPWWKQPEYARPFVNDSEKEEFRAGDLEQSPYAEEEVELLSPGPIDTETGENVPLSLEQLNWRRWCIANRCGGKVEKFHQEYPASPEQAFLSTGRKVFEPMLVARAMAKAEKTDPRFGEGGPISGAVVASKREMRAGRHGKVETPLEPIFKPARLLSPADDSEAFWRFWLDYQDGKLVIPEDGQYVAAADVSDGLPESGEGDPAYQALVVIDHKTGEQVAEYRSRVDPDLFAEHAYLTSVLFNKAWLAVEKTGTGMAVARTIWHDFHYTFTYWRRRHETKGEDQTDNLGWDTNRVTKPILLAGGAELLREETHGIKSRRVVAEMQTYIRLSTGKTVPERGKYSDLLMAWLIAKQVALEKPVRKPKGERKPRQNAARYSAYRR